MGTNFYLRPKVKPNHPLFAPVEIHIGKRSNGGGGLVFNFQGYRDDDRPRLLGLSEGDILGWSDWRKVLTGEAGSVDFTTTEIVDEYGQAFTPQEFIQEIEGAEYTPAQQRAYFERYHLNDNGSHALIDGFNVSYRDFF